MGKDMEVSIQVGERIRNLRIEQHITVERLAEQVDISVQYVSDIERGRKNMTIPIFKNMVLALHTRADYLLFGKTELDPISDLATQRLSDMPPIDRVLISKILIGAAGMVEDLGLERE